ncbi:hypothetical protein HDU67_005801, partial [Dinochytrium kinnereticum]
MAEESAFLEMLNSFTIPSLYSTAQVTTPATTTSPNPPVAPSISDPITMALLSSAVTNPAFSSSALASANVIASMQFNPFYSGLAQSLPFVDFTGMLGGVATAPSKMAGVAPMTPSELYNFNTSVFSSPLSVFPSASQFLSVMPSGSFLPSPTSPTLSFTDMLHLATQANAAQESLVAALNAFQPVEHATPIKSPVPTRAKSTAAPPSPIIISDDDEPSKEETPIPDLNDTCMTPQTPLTHTSPSRSATPVSPQSPLLMPRTSCCMDEGCALSQPSG